jgi:hypothetical protein
MSLNTKSHEFSHHFQFRALKMDIFIFMRRLGSMDPAANLLQFLKRA